MRIYISGPISGTDDATERFDEAEMYLRKLFPYCDIINPERLSVVMPDNATHGEYMKICFDLLEMANAIYMLNGWEKSSGACQEYGFAWAKDITILSPAV